MIHDFQYSSNTLGLVLHNINTELTGNIAVKIEDTIKDTNGDPLQINMQEGEIKKNTFDFLLQLIIRTIERKFVQYYVWKRHCHMSWRYPRNVLLEQQDISFWMQMMNDKIGQCPVL